MDFTLTEEQTLLRDSVRRFLDRHYAFDARRKRVERGNLFSSDTWSALAEQGWIGAAISESSGGFGGPVEAALVAHELGRALVLEPYVMVAVLAAQLLLADGYSASQIDSLIGGETRPVLAHEESAAGPLFVTTTATRSGENYVINGAKLQVIGAPSATKVLVSARTAGAMSDRDGISLFHLARDLPGMLWTPYRLIDGTAVADLVLHEVRVSSSALIGVVGAAGSTIDLAYDHATIALCAQSVGAMERAVEITRDYLNTRKQFGVLIGSFQAMQHRLADMVIHLEQARTMAYRGLAYLNAAPAQRRHAVAAAKAQMGRSAKYIAAQSIQLHGGIGVTDEYSIGHYFKHLTVAESLFGTTAEQLAVIARMRSGEA